MMNNSILLIDDEKIIRDTVSHDLEKWGYAVDTASNGEEGVQKFKNNPSCAIIAFKQSYYSTKLQ